MLRAVRALLARIEVASGRVFVTATALIVAHMLLDATFCRPMGTSVGANLGTIVLPCVIANTAMLGFSLMRPGARAWVAFVFGTLAAADGALHVAHLRRGGGIGGNDVSGLIAGAAGVVLVLLAGALVLRPKGSRTPRQRIAKKLGALLGVAATIILLVIPLEVTVYIVHKQPVHVPDSALKIEHENVTLQTSDGLDLAAWYIRPKRGHGVVITVNGSGGDRRGGILSRTKLLARNGFGVLSYDPRGAGDSEGRPENLGWTWHRDVEAAVKFLRKRGERRIGILGLSTGAEAAIQTAGSDSRIDAVVAEGAQARSFRETWLLPKFGEKVNLVITLGIPFAGNSLLSRVSPPPTLKRKVRKIAPRPVFLISSGTGFERDINRVYYDAAKKPKLLWEVTDAPHTGGLTKHPQQYERRVIGFFELWLA